MRVCDCCQSMHESGSDYGSVTQEVSVGKSASCGDYPAGFPNDSTMVRVLITRVMTVLSVIVCVFLTCSFTRILVCGVRILHGNILLGI